MESSEPVQRKPHKRLATIQLLPAHVCSNMTNILLLLEKVCRAAGAAVVAKSSQLLVLGQSGAMCPASDIMPFYGV